MPGSPNIDDRLRMLEAELRRLQALADLAPERPARMGGPRNPRWAITCKKDAETSYPVDTDTPNTYWIKFLDSTYTDAEGDQTPDDTERQTEGACLAHYRDADPYRYLAEGTEVVVFFDNRQWWIIGVMAGEGNILWGIVQANGVNAGEGNDRGDVLNILSVCSITWDATEWAEPTGDAFDVLIPPQCDPASVKGYIKDTAVFDDYIVGYQVEPDGTKLAVVTHWDDPIGTRRLIGGDDAIRDGWEEDEDTRDRFIRGLPNGGELEYEVTGGINDTSPPLVGHQHTMCGYLTHFEVTEELETGVDIWAFDAPDDYHMDPVMVPKYIQYKWIKRVE